MQSRDFCYWLQGFFEISNKSEFTPQQVNMIRNHLNLVFRHEIDPSMGSLAHQFELNQIHNDGVVLNSVHLDSDIKIC